MPLRQCRALHFVALCVSLSGPGGIGQSERELLATSMPASRGFQANSKATVRCLSRGIGRARVALAQLLADRVDADLNWFDRRPESVRYKQTLKILR